MPQKFSYIRLLTDNFEKTFDFYSSVLGLELKFGSRDESYAEFETGTTDIALFQREEMEKQTGLEVPSLDQLQSNVIIIIQVEDVNAQYEFLENMDVNILTEPTTRKEWDVRTFHCLDPEGNLIEINSRLDQ